MNKIAVLIDFTEGCKIAIEQAKVLADKANAELHAVHFANGEATENDLTEFTRAVLGGQTEFKTVFSTGDLMHNVAFVMGHIDPMFVVVGTHGIKGIKQHLFGAYILKLVQAVPYPCLVVQENTKVNKNGIGKILFPVDSHKMYHIKTEQTASLARLFNSTVVQYEIERTMVEPASEAIKNKKEAREYFENEEIAFEEVVEDTTVVSLGYARQTIKFATENHFDVISVMSDVPAEEVYLGRADKENILTNPAGIPVLCCNK